MVGTEEVAGLIILEIEESDMEVRFHRLAAREYEDARNWYERRGTGLGDEFVSLTPQPHPIDPRPTD
jgi:hypothetical protein